MSNLYNIPVKRITGEPATLGDYKGNVLLVVNVALVDGHTPDGNPLLVVDWLGAGRGDRVLLTSDGPAVQKHLRDAKTPVRYSVAGIVDP